jgi:hypothetical protein
MRRFVYACALALTLMVGRSQTEDWTGGPSVGLRLSSSVISL